MKSTFKVSSVPLSSQKKSVNGILVAQCDHCNYIVSIPHQSSPRIKEIINSKKYSIEVRLPIHLLDILCLASNHLDVESGNQLKDSLIKYYISLADTDKMISKNLKKFSESDFAKGSGYRLSIKVNQATFRRFEHLMDFTKLNKTQLLKGIILQINEDILQKPRKKMLNDLERLMLALA